MFGWGKRKTVEAPATSEVPGPPLIASLIVEPLEYPIAELQRKLARTSIRGIAPTEVLLKDGMLGFQLKDELAMVAPMPAPYPWSDLEGPCATSWMWPKETPATTLKSCKSHTLITLIGGSRDRIERCIILTQLAALAASLNGVKGVFWPEATVVHFPPVFQKMAQEIKTPLMQMYLWVDFRVARNKDGTFALFTTGLPRLGSMDLEIPSINLKPGELREWAMNIAIYLRENGPRVKDGDTIGPTADIKLRIRMKRSLYGRPGTVVRLEG